MDQNEQLPHTLEVSVQINEHDIANILFGYLQQQLKGVVLERDDEFYTDGIGNSYRDSGELISTALTTTTIINALNIFRHGSLQPSPLQSHTHEKRVPTILIADDDESMRIFFRAVLETALEIEIIESSDGVEALARCEESPPDLVILDMVMPNKDGFETGRELTRLGIPFIAATSLEDEESIKRICQIGCYSFISKPARAAQVLGVITSALTQIQQSNVFKNHKSSTCDICTARGAISSMLSIPPDQAYEVLKEMGRDNHGNTRNTAATVNEFLEFMAKANSKHQARQKRQLNKSLK